MSEYTARLPLSVKRELARQHGDFEQAMDELLESFTEEAPTLPSISGSYHLAADRFARNIQNRKKPVCKRFPLPSDPWEAVS